MGFTRHFFSGNRQEVNSTWFPEIEEPIKSHEKHYSLVLYILKEYVGDGYTVGTIRNKFVCCDLYSDGKFCTGVHAICPFDNSYP